jgi:exodeoxyribonuclease-3
VKIASYNVNGIRSALNKGLGLWLESERPDVICFQEIKAEKEQVDTSLFEHLGYRHYWHSAEKKGYSGVAVLCAFEPEAVVQGTGVDYIDREGRVLRVDYQGRSYYSVYFPSGSSGDERQEVKMRFLKDIANFFQKAAAEGRELVICGDFNICHRPIDIHDPIRNATVSGFLPEERAWMDSFFSLGFVDGFRAVVSEPHQYSWWSYRANARNNNKGWRIDYTVLSASLQANIRSASIQPFAVHSDHCPVLIELSDLPNTAL